MDRLVEILLRIYPAEFRRRFGEDVRHQLRLDLAETRKNGRVRWTVAAAGLLRDLALAGLRERLDAIASAWVRRRRLGTRPGWVDSVHQDFAQAARSLGRRPAFAAAAVVILGLGVLVNVGVFSMALATLSPKVQGVSEPGKLVSLFQYSSEQGYYSSLSLPTYQDYRESIGSLQGLAAYTSAPANLIVEEDSYRIHAQLVSANFFQVLGIQPSPGRGFRPTRDPDEDRSVILAHSTWERFFAARSDIVGATIRLGTESFTVIGVAPAAFHGMDLESPADLWVTLDARGSLTTYPEEMVQGRGMHWLSTVGRLAPGASVAQVASEVDALATALADSYPDVQGGWEARVRTLREAVIWPEQRDSIRRVTVMLGAVALLILILACVTLASMELAHVMAHREEAAVRMALGSGRWNLIRRQLAQALLLTVPGLGLGLLGGAWAIRWTSLRSVIPRLPSGLDLQPDWRLLAGAVLLTPVLALIVGVLPALQTGRAEPAAAMKSHRSGETRRVGKLRRTLSIVQVAISVAVLSAAGTLTRSAGAQISHDLGFDPEGVLLVSVDPQLSGYDEEERWAFYKRSKESVENLPAVRSAAVSAFVPLTGPRLGADVQFRDSEGVERTLNVTGNIVSPDYFRAMGIPLLSGRDIGEEASGPRGQVVINEAAAREFWGSANPLGQEVDLGSFLGGPAVVVGVARDLGAGRGLFASPRPSVFVPLWRRPWASGTLHLRIQGNDPLALAEQVRRALASTDPSVPVYDVRTLKSLVDSSLAPALSMAEAVGLLGILGLLLAAAGIYGVVAQSVSRRLHEFGVRMAVGASRTAVGRQVLREGGAVFAGGLALGIPGAFLLARLLRTSLFGVEAFDPATLGAAVALTAGVTAVALMVPASRAAAVDPAEALRRQ